MRLHSSIDVGVLYIYDSIKYLTWWQEHYFAHLALRSQDNSNAIGGYEIL